MCPLLVNHLDTRIRSNIKAQLPIEDLKFVYSNLPTKHIYRQLVVEYLSYAIEDPLVRVKNWSALQQFRNGNKEYEKEISEFRAMLHGPERKAKKAAYEKRKAENYAAYLTRKEKREERQAKWEAQHIQNEKEKTARVAFHGVERLIPGACIGVQGRKHRNGKHWYKILPKTAPLIVANSATVSETATAFTDFDAEIIESITSLNEATASPTTNSQNPKKPWGTLGVAKPASKKLGASEMSSTEDSAKLVSPIKKPEVTGPEDEVRKWLSKVEVIKDKTTTDASDDGFILVVHKKHKQKKA